MPLSRSVVGKGMAPLDGGAQKRKEYRKANQDESHLPISMRSGVPPPSPPYCCPYPCPYCTLTPSLPSRSGGAKAASGGASREASSISGPQSRASANGSNAGRAPSAAAAGSGHASGGGRSGSPESRESTQHGSRSQDSTQHGVGALASGRQRLSRAGSRSPRDGERSARLDSTTLHSSAPAASTSTGALVVHALRGLPPPPSGSAPLPLSY